MLNSFTPMYMLIVKKEEINASKIYSPVGNLAERAKLFCFCAHKHECRS